jgi:hypothetical protein
VVEDPLVPVTLISYGVLAVRPTISPLATCPRLSELVQIDVVVYLYCNLYSTPLRLVQATSMVLDVLEVVVTPVVAAR